MLGAWVVIRVTTFFNFQRNNIALQVAAICCSYYFTFSVRIRFLLGLVLMFELGLIYTVFSEEQNPAPPSINSIFRYCIFLLQVNDIINRKFNIFQNNPFCHIFFCIFRTFLFVVVKTRETVFFHAAPTNVTLVIQVPVITLISQFSINFEVNNWQKQGTI